MIENVSTQLTVFHCLCPLPASRKGLRLPLRSALFGEGGRDWRPCIRIYSFGRVHSRRVHSRMKFYGAISHYIRGHLPVHWGREKKKDLFIVHTQCSNDNDMMVCK